MYKFCGVDPQHQSRPQNYTNSKEQFLQFPFPGANKQLVSVGTGDKNSHRPNSTSGKHDISGDVFISLISLLIPQAHTYTNTHLYTHRWSGKKKEMPLISHTLHVPRLLSGRSLTHCSAPCRGDGWIRPDPCFISRCRAASGGLWKLKHILYAGRSLSDLRASQSDAPAGVILIVLQAAAANVLPPSEMLQRAGPSVKSRRVSASSVIDFYKLWITLNLKDGDTVHIICLMQ